MRSPSPFLAIAAAVLLPAPVLFQGALIDQGSFTITVNGQRAGREDFRILGPGGGQGPDYIASATVVYGSGGRRLEPELRADSTGTPTYYTVEIKSAGTSQEKWTANIVRGRVSAKIQNPRGESAREFIATTGALLLDDDVYHQYYFIAHRVTNGAVTVIVPQRNTQMQLRVSAAGTDHVTIGSQDLEARHLVLTESDGAKRDLWVDTKDRVLKVAIPSRGIVAIRDDPPR
jgi:hypothetical protein